MFNWGAVFDWDGVLIGSAEFHEISWNELAKEEQQQLPPDHFEQGFGRVNSYIIPNILKWSSDPREVSRLANRKEAIYRDIVRDRGIQPLKGVLPFLEILQKNKIPCVIGSSTPRVNIECVLELNQLGDFF